MESPDVRLAKMAARQHSVVSRKQVLALGMTLRQLYRRLDQGVLAAVHQNVYRIVAASPTWEQSVMAACLASGGVASHRSAAGLWALRGIESPPVEILLPAGRHPQLRDVTIHRSKLWTPDQASRRGPIPVTKPALTVLQLGAVAPELVAGAAEDALFRRLITVAGLWKTIESHGAQGRDGTAVLRHLLTTRDPAQAPTESSLEDAIVASCAATAFPSRRASTRCRGLVTAGRFGSTPPIPSRSSTSRATACAGTPASKTSGATASGPTIWSPRAGCSCATAGTTCGRARSAWRGRWAGS